MNIDVLLGVIELLHRKLESIQLRPGVWSRRRSAYAHLVDLSYDVTSVRL